MDPNSIINKVKNHTPAILGSESFSDFAVFIPLVMIDNEIHILFEVRSQSLRRQPGEVCFPGGKIDEQDESPQDAAIRETIEELGVNREAISDVSGLDYMVSPFGMIVYPYVGVLKHIESLEPNSSEVGEVFTVPLHFFLEIAPDVYQVNIDVKPEGDFPFDLIPGGKNYKWRVSKMNEFFYNYKDRTIWGLTAKIIKHFIEVIR